MVVVKVGEMHDVATRGMSVRQKAAMFVSTTTACYVLTTRLGTERTAVNKKTSPGRLFWETGSGHHPLLTSRADH